MTHLRMARETRVEMLEKKSRFVAIGMPLENVASFQDALTSLKDEFPDVDHITYAYRILEQGELRVRCYDADEPSGTAGKPILSHLEGMDVMNVGIFVLRYFGGIKLGTGGLVRAYGTAARLCLLSAPLVEDIPEVLAELRFDYKDQRQIEYFLARQNAEILQKDFGDAVLFRFKVTEPFWDELEADLREINLAAKKLKISQ